MKSLSFILLLATVLLSCNNNAETKTKSIKYRFYNKTTKTEVYKLEYACELKQQGNLLVVDQQTCEEFDHLPN